MHWFFKGQVLQASVRYDEVIFIINNVLDVVSNFYNSFGNKNAAAVGIRGANLFIIRVI